MKKGGGHYFIVPVVVGVVACLLFLAGAYHFFFRYNEHDEKEYRRLMIISNPALAGDTDHAPYTARQKRVGVRKDFTYQKNGIPLSVKLLSREAELVLDRQESSMQIIENMYGVRVYMQEELYYLLPDGREAVLQEDGRLLLRDARQQEEALWISSDDPGLKPMQILRYLEADSGSYLYKNDKCVAANVTVERYVLPSHSFEVDFSEGKLIFKALADRVEFVMSGSDPQFTAHKMKATVFRSKV